MAFWPANPVNSPSVLVCDAIGSRSSRHVRRVLIAITLGTRKEQERVGGGGGGGGTRLGHAKSGHWDGR